MLVAFALGVVRFVAMFVVTSYGVRRSEVMKQAGQNLDTKYTAKEADNQDPSGGFGGVAAILEGLAGRGEDVVEGREELKVVNGMFSVVRGKRRCTIVPALRLREQERKALLSWMRKFLWLGSWRMGMSMQMKRAPSIHAGELISFSRIWPSRSSFEIHLKSSGTSGSTLLCRYRAPCLSGNVRLTMVSSGIWVLCRLPDHLMALKLFKNQVGHGTSQEVVEYVGYVLSWRSISEES